MCNYRYITAVGSHGRDDNSQTICRWLSYSRK